MAFQRPFLISLRREDSREPWGFRLDGGGVTSRPVTVQQVLERSVAERAGLHEGDQVIQIGRMNVQGRTLSEVQELILTCKNRVEMFVIREDLLRNRKENEPLTVKAVVHSPYNSPFQLYSQDNVAETLATQACIISDPNIQPNHFGPTSPPTVIRSNVLDALREQGERGARVNGEVLGTPPVKKKKQPPPVPPKPRRNPSSYPLSPPVRAGIYPGNMEQAQYQNFSTVHREEKRTTTQKTSNYVEYEEEEEEEETEEEEEEPVVTTTTTTKTFKSQTSFTPQQSEQQRSQQQTQQTVRTQQTIQQETRQKEYQQQQQQQQLQQQQQQQEQQRRAEIARQQQQQAYEQQQRQIREQQQRQAYEQQQRQIREQQAREQQAREQQARDLQRAREQQAREQQAREQQAREQHQRQAAQQRQAFEQQQAREAYERQQRQTQMQAQQAYDDQQRQAQLQRRAQEEQQRQAQLRAQQQGQYDSMDPNRKMTSTTRVVPANLGSPVTQRRGNCPAWPPKNSSVRELPKTGFSPSFVQERGSKQFVWPPPKPEDMLPQGSGEHPHVTGHAGEAWHPQETPATSRPLVPRSPTPTRRLGDQVWPPKHTLVDEDAAAANARPMPRPVCRRGRFDDYIQSTASANVPPTYRLPPGTVHVNIVY